MSEMQWALGDPKGQCQAIPNDELNRAAVELEIWGAVRHCSRSAKHWTHAFTEDTRLALCTQHFNMIERRRRLASADATLASWYQSH